MDKNVGIILQEWIACKRESPECSVEEFLLKKYLEFHKNDLGDDREKTEKFRRWAETCRKTEEKFEACVGEYIDAPELEMWQGTEMLENVILELEMDETERYRYLLNVDAMIEYKLIKCLDQTSGEALIAILEQKYQEEWEKAEKGVTEEDFQERFSETISIMRYAGIAYDDESRKVLAEIGVGWHAEFQNDGMENVKGDICFMMDFLLSEMVVTDKEWAYSKKEQELLTGQVVPVCVSSASMIREGAAPGHVMRLAYSYLARVFTKKNIKILMRATAIFIAAKVLLYIFELAMAGKILEVGLTNLWKWCNAYLKVRLPGKLMNSLLTKISGVKHQEQKGVDIEENQNDIFEGLTTEEEYENV